MVTLTFPMEQVIAEKESKNAMILAMQDDAKTIVEENEANLLGRTSKRWLKVSVY